MAAALAVGTASVGVPATAQVVGGGLVVVNISNVANNLAQNLSVDVQDVIDIGSVQVPIGIAANVCGIDANVLAADAKDGAVTCNAETTNRALTQIVQRQLNAQ
jgi:peptide deformylase